ncbi:MAG: FHA domain-containing protein [Thermosynechococcaceae cyanobacterium]
MSNTAAKLEVRRGGVFVKEIQLDQTAVTLGRAPDNSISLSDDLTVSRHHAQLAWTGHYFALTDLSSSIGTFVNDEKLVPHQPRSLSSGDRIRIGTFQLTFAGEAGSLTEPISDLSYSQSSQTLFAAEGNLSTPAREHQTLDLKGRDVLSIGRDAINDMVINHPSCSRFHAQIKKMQGDYVLVDLNSTNGTFLNGKPLTERRVLKVGDIIRVGPTNLTFNLNETLSRVNEEGNLRLDAIAINKRINKDLNLLNNISLSIQAREFVAIAGVSGGGKSTLLDALNGFRPATSGYVLVNGTDLYKNFNAYRNEIGYVPQKDIVHMELTVEQALDFSGKLRMPADTTRAERKQRVDEVLEDLNLTARRSVSIKALSGGQLKRVSIGVELLTKPSLFFLDEATSGLDPGTETELMQLLRELADQGRTILLITHATENVTLCDQVVFMARGGNVAYFGPPKEATTHFGVERFNQIYRRVEHELSPEQWSQQYKDSPQHQQYVVDRQQNLQMAGNSQGKRLRHQTPGANVKRVSAWRQFLILSQRNLAILVRDRINLLLMLAVAPLIGLLDLMTWRTPLFSTKDGNPGLTITMLFMTILFAVMVGSLPTMREIVKEIDIYKRERIIGLQIFPYVLSKVWLSVILALYQAGVFLLFKIISVSDFPSDSGVLLGMYFTLVLAFIGGMLMGLLGSAIAPNQGVAPLLVLIFLVPQIIFGGGVFPLDTFGPSGQLFNKLSLTKWPFEALVTLSGMGQDIAKDPCWIQVIEGDKKLDDFKDTDKDKCPCMGPSIFKDCNFPGIGESYKPVVDEPEPSEPKKPNIRSQSDQDQYEKDLDQYQEDLIEWTLKREGAISAAEGKVNGLTQKFSQTYDVDVQQYWIIFSGFIVSMLGLILGIQKVKDLF